MEPSTRWGSVDPRAGGFQHWLCSGGAAGHVPLVNLCAQGVRPVGLCFDKS